MIRLELEGERELSRRLARIAPEAQRKALLAISQAVYGKAVDGADAHTKTGHMARSTYNSKAGVDARLVGHDAPYSVFVHWGARAHVIKPKKKKALRWPAGGAFAFAQSVNHPGYAGDKWLQRAADHAIRNFDQLINQALRGI